MIQFEARAKNEDGETCIAHFTAPTETDARRFVLIWADCGGPMALRRSPIQSPYDVPAPPTHTLGGVRIEQ